MTFESILSKLSHIMTAHLPLICRTNVYKLIYLSNEQINMKATRSLHYSLYFRYSLDDLLTDIFFIEKIDVIS